MKKLLLLLPLLCAGCASTSVGIEEHSEAFAGTNSSITTIPYNQQGSTEEQKQAIELEKEFPNPQCQDTDSDIVFVSKEREKSDWYKNTCLLIKQLKLSTYLMGTENY